MASPFTPATIPSGGSPLTTKGDVYTFSTVDARLGVGANDTVLTADSAQATGLKFAAVAGGAVVGARVFNSAAESIADSAWTALTFDSETFDSDAFHDTGTNPDRLTVPTGKGGTYLLVGLVEFASNLVGVRGVRIRLNGAGNGIARIFDGPNAGNDILGVTLSCIYPLVATNFVTLEVFQSSGGALNVDAASRFTPDFMLARLGT